LNENDLREFMTFRKEGKKISPLFVSKINDKFMIAVYQGTISDYDILIKYRQKEGKKWSNIRTPKHIHWAVDILIKMHSNKEKTRQFLDFLFECWEKTKPIRSHEERERILSIEHLLESSRQEIEEYEELGKRGEYSIKFLILLAKLLMLQEKTNLETAYMFKNLLEALKSGEDIFKIVSIASHTGGRKR
jgi:hypothetical protein